MKLEFSRQISKKKKKINHILRKSVQLEPNCSMRTHRHDSANSRIPQFCKPSQKVTHLLWTENTPGILDGGMRTAAVQRHYDVKNTR